MINYANRVPRTQTVLLSLFHTENFSEKIEFNKIRNKFNNNTFTEWQSKTQIKEILQMLDLSVSKYEISLPKYVAKKFSLNNSACVWCCTCGMQVQIWPASHKPIPVSFLPSSTLETKIQ